jgi:hypothetical protein
MLRLLQSSHRQRARRDISQSSRASQGERVTGPKQIAWAETLRSDKIGQMREILKMVNEYPIPVPAATLAAIHTIADKLNTETNSRYWIDNRDVTAKSLVREQLRLIAEIAPKMVA